MLEVINHGKTRYGRQGKETKSCQCSSLHHSLVLAVTPPEKISVAAPTMTRLIDDHPSYHGAVTHKEAEARLRKHGGNCYLTRYSTGRNTFVLSVMKSNENIRHFDVNITTETCEINGTNLPFSDIFQLLVFYAKATSQIDDETGSIGEACIPQTKALLSSQILPSHSSAVDDPSEVHGPLKVSF